MTRSPRAVLAAIIGLTLAPAGSAGCAPTYGDAYLEAFAAGERALLAGRHDEAARAFSSAALKARRVKDRDEARFLEGRSLERIGKYSEARQAYEKLLAHPGPRTARAEFEIAELDIDHGDAERGWARLYEAARRHPEHGLARRAIQILAARAADDRGEEARLAWLHEREADLRGTDLAQVFAYEIALSLERLERDGPAHDAFLAVAARYPYPFGVFTDDALWHAALLDEKADRPGEAIEHLKLLISSREVSTGMGSYERPRYSAAQLKIAEIYRDKIKDHAAARREFHKLYASFTTSTLRDDALFAEALMLRDDKDEGGACAAMEALTKDFPDSRYAACAQAICPTAQPSKRSCAAYIVRRIRGDAGDAPEGEEQPDAERATP